MIFTAMFFIISCTSTPSVSKREPRAKSKVKYENTEEIKNSITFTLNDNIVSYVKENILKNDIISKDTLLEINYGLNEDSNPQMKSESILLEELDKKSFTLQDIPEKKHFNVSIEILYNGEIVYDNMSERIAISKLDPNPEVVFPEKHIPFQITYNLNNGRNSELNPSEYQADSFVYLSAPERNNSDFIGWYTSPNFAGTPVTDFYGSDYPDGITLYARWAMKNNIQDLMSEDKDNVITLSWTNPSDKNFRKVIVSSPQLYNNITVKGSPSQHISIDIPVTSNTRTYTFTLVTEDRFGNKSSGISVTEEIWTPFTEEVVFLEEGTDGTAGTGGMYVLFGDYPQTEKAPEVSILGPDTTNNSSYYKGDDGYFYAELNNKYYKVEPIKWRVVTENYIDSNGIDNGCLLIAENALTAEPYHINYVDRVIDDNIISANNYEYSNIRAYLNGLDGTYYHVSDYSGKGFLDEAFTQNAQEIINYTGIDNTPESTGRRKNDFACNNTNDKVFLASFSEIVKGGYGFNERYNKPDKIRTRTATDYAKAQSSVDMLSDGTCTYWLRSPVNYPDEMLMYIGYTDGTLKQYMVDNRFGRVVPAITVYF